MNICLIGDGLTSLVLANNLINKNINVSIVCNNNNKIKNSNTRTVGISKNNLKFLNQEKVKLKKSLIWKIDQIELYNEKSQNEKILSFSSHKEELFSIIKNDNIYDYLNKNLKRSKLFKKFFIQDRNLLKKISKNKKYDLIINCDGKNQIAKKYFSRKINKNYNSYAYTTIVKHEKIKNSKAIQIFTKIGPIAFLPISQYETSIVYSIFDTKILLNEKNLRDLILRYNKNFNIKTFSKIQKTPLNFSVARNYYYKDFMAFGDMLHKIHPLAGQGFNMNLRDIKILSKLIQNRIDLGLPIDISIYKEFEKQTKHLNFIFSTSIDFIYEFFKFEGKYNKDYSKNILKVFGKNKILNNLLSNFADNGLVI